MASLIIIRLQNLPWEANSQDIRRFFDGLSIPEGGVHIVGGDRGDAFIAFATDEDARQAMAKDGQEIKGIKVKLLLSSNSEMQKIVEQARQAHLTMMSATQLPVVPNILAQVVAPKQVDMVKKPTDVVVIKEDGASRKRSRSRSRERRRSRSRDRKRDRSRDRKRSKSRSRDRAGRSRGGRRRSRSRSRDRRDRNGRDRRRSDESKDGLSSRDALSETSAPTENNDTPVWEPGMQPGASLGTASALPFMGLPALAGLPTNFSNLLQGMQNGLPVNPLVMAQALAQSAVVQNAVPVIPPAISEIANARPTQSTATVTLPTVAKIPGLKNALLPTPETTPARKATPPPPSNLPVFPMFKNQTAIGNSTVNAAPALAGAKTAVGTTNGNGLSIETLHFRMSGMQQLPNYIDIKHFFCGVSLPNGSIRFKWEGRFPMIYLSVKDLDDAKIVQKLDGELLGQTPVHMKPIDRIEFLKGEEFYVETPHQMDSLRFNRPGQGLVLGGRAKPIEQDLVVVIIGIPFEVTEQDVREFLAGINVTDVFIEYNQAGQSIGHCFVKLASHNDLELSLGQCGHRIKHRNVEVLVANQQIFTESKELYEKKRRPSATAAATAAGQRPTRTHEKRPSRFSNIDDPPVPVTPAPPTRFGIDPSKTVLSIHGLPFDIVDRQIGEMCAELGVKVDHIHIKNGSNPREPSCAFVECHNAEDAAVVANMSGQPYYGYTLTIEAVTMDFMRNSMNASLPSPLMPPFGMPPMGPQGFEGPGGLFRGRGRGRGRPGRGAPALFPMNGALPYPGHGMGVPMAGDPMAGLHNGTGAVPSAAKPPLPELPILSPTDPFANPQCVVAICNLNYAAGVEDLIEVFKDYNIRKDLIMRRYNEQNQPTGDARVAFATPKDAADAVKRFNGTQLLGRTLRLTLLAR